MFDRIRVSLIRWMRNIAFEVLIYMEKKQIRLNTGIQKRYTKKVNKGKVVAKKVQKNKPKRAQKLISEKEMRRAFMSGWQQGIKYGKNPKDYKKKVNEILQSKRDRAQGLRSR